MNNSKESTDPTETESRFQSNATLARVTVKIPPFWKSDPKIWFMQIEAQFRNNGIITDQTKFDLVVSSIDAEILAQVSEIVVNPPPKEKYEALKSRLISVFADTETQKLQKLLTDLELGDKKPSQLLSEMRNLAENKVSDNFLKSLWMQRLPFNMRSILSVSCDELSKLADMADKIWEIKPEPYQNTTVSSCSDESILVNLQKQISQLTLQVNELKDMRLPIHRQFRSRSRSRSVNKHNKSNDICYYHSRFGEKAFKCQQPCNWVTEIDNQESEN